MVPSEELELRIYRFAEFAGRGRWQAADLGALATSLQFMEQAVLVDALDDLHERSFLAFRQWSSENNDWLLYAGRTPQFFSYPFELKVTFPGRKYFEALDAKLAPSSLSGQLPDTPLEAALTGRATVQATLDSSPQPISATIPGTPKAFVSHATQDRQVVDRFTSDLRAYGVDAWYSPWEIKSGDSIPVKIEEGLEGCAFFIFVISKGSLTRPWVRMELDIAVARRNSGKLRKIIPITIDDSEDIPAIIDSLCREDFSNSAGYDSALKRVLDSIFDVDVRPTLGKRPTEQKGEHSI